ncbi:MAG: hypothetical protein KH828_00020 [Clostridiales bacterium]|nr:hypothetical protein [Clostridiales bacterium]
MKRYIAFLMMCIILISSTISVYADTKKDTEWYEMTEEELDVPKGENAGITPYGAYLMGVYTSLTKISSSKVGIRADVMCSDAVSKIQIVFTLQKKSGSSWKDVATKTVYDYNVSSTTKTVSISGVSSGTYRASAAALVTDKYGYSESSRSYTGSITI